MSEIPRFSPTAMLSFDLETTTNQPRKARIVTSAMVRIDASGAHPEELLADPGIDIPAEAQAVHGISTEYARTHGRPHKEVLATTVTRIKDAWAEGLGLVVFNAPYDLTVLLSLDDSFTVDGLVYDPLLIDRMKVRFRKGVRRNLGSLAQVYQVRIDQAHAATDDALAAARIAWMQLKKWPELGEMSGAELMEYQMAGYYDLQTDLRNYFEREGRPTEGVNTSWPMYS